MKRNINQIIKFIVVPACFATVTALISSALLVLLTTILTGLWAGATERLVGRFIPFLLGWFIFFEVLTLLPPKPRKLPKS